jgi:putative ABC transport system substrate-binding protein
MMHRRAFIGGVMGGLLLSVPLFGAAERSGRVLVVGILNNSVGPRSRSVDATRRGLREIGYVDGRTIVFEVRFAGGKPERYPAFAADLIRRKVDVVLAIGPPALRAARDATSTIPIVALDLESDPIQAGFARSFASPGGNITGCFLDQPGLTGKWLELMGEAVPGNRRVAVLRDPTTGPWQLAAIKRAAVRLSIDLQVIEVRSLGELDQALGAVLVGGLRPLVQLSSPLFDLPAANTIAEFTAKHHVPAISMFRSFAEAGGLMSYGPNQPEYFKRLPVYIDRILKGANPADLPIEQPTTFDFVINLRTAKAFGLTIPQSLRVQAELID